MKKYNQVRQFSFSENSSSAPGKTKNRKVQILSPVSATERGRRVVEVILHLNLILVSVEVYSQTRHRQILADS